MNCPHCHKPVQEDFEACPYCQKSLIAEALLTNPFESSGRSPQTPGGQNTGEEGDATGGVSPYKNPKALIAYYLVIVSGLPLIGCPFGRAAFVSGLPLIGFSFGIAAFVFGILGLWARWRNPAVKGSSNAWFGIGCGGAFAIFWGLIILSFLVKVNFV